MGASAWGISRIDPAAIGEPARRGQNRTHVVTDVKPNDVQGLQISVILHRQMERLATPIVVHSERQAEVLERELGGHEIQHSLLDPFSA